MSKKISIKTVLYTMRIVGSIVIVTALGLIAYLTWITSHVGLDGFLMAAFGIGIVSVIVAVLMIYFSYRITFEEEKEVDTEVVPRKEKTPILPRKCG